MIVKCDKCQTRFKIPDEKVTEKGVKVRCTRCQNTFRVARGPDAARSEPPDAPAPAPIPPPTRDADPFAQFEVRDGPDPRDRPDPMETTRPGFFVEGVNASRGAPLFSAHKDVPSDLFELPTRVGPLPQEVRDELGGAPSPAPAGPAFDPSNPFDDIPTSPTAPAAPAYVAELARQSTARPMSDFELTSPNAPKRDPFALMADPFAAPPAPQPDAASLQAIAAPFELSEPQASVNAAELSAGLLGELPPPEDPFEALGARAEPDRRLFDMPEPRPAFAIDEPAMEQAPPPSMPGPAFDLGPLERPAGRPEDVGMAEARRPSRARRGLGLVVNLVVGALLVIGLLTVGTIYLNEGKVDLSALSLEPLKALFSTPSELVAVDVSNGLYDTRGGRPVFFVRGEAENRGSAPERLVVSVQILDGALVLTEGTVLAGVAPTPEDLYGIAGPKDLSALNARLDAQAREVKPGERVPFVVAFYEYPPELSQYRLRVTVQKAPAGKSAAR